MSIISHYESCLKKYGDTHLGVGWPNKDDVYKRYKVMLDIIRSGKNLKVSLLDLGCGASHLYEYIIKNNLNHIEYSGLDLSEKFVHLSRSKYPSVPYYCLDILDNRSRIPSFDYIVMNGVFTEKRSLSFDDMLDYLEKVVKKVFSKANMGIAFNLMSKHVEWEREDLFHVPFDTLAKFLTKDVSRNFAIMNDYGLYEYTTYVYK